MVSIDVGSLFKAVVNPIVKFYRNDAGPIFPKLQTSVALNGILKDIDAGTAHTLIKLWSCVQDIIHLRELGTPSPALDKDTLERIDRFISTTSTEDKNKLVRFLTHIEIKQLIYSLYPSKL